MNTIKLKGLKIKIPKNLEIEAAIDLDEIFSSQPHSDILLVVRQKERRVAVIIEDTGVPKPEDISRLEQTEEILRNKIIPGNTISLKLLHHRGIKKRVIH